MKKIALILSFTISSCILNAQFEKGDQSVSGLINARIADRGSYFHSSFEGIYQYFIFKNFSVGAGIQYDYGMVRSLDERYNAHTLYFKPEARYYFFNGKFRPYVYANMGIGVTFGNAIYQQYRFQPFTVGTGAGFSWFLTDRLALESRLGINVQMHKGKLDYARPDFKIGLQYSIPSGNKKKAQKQE